MKPSSFEVRAFLLLLWLISDACGIKTGNFPCVHRNELGSDHPPSSVSFSDVSSQIGLNERQCEVRTSPNCLFPQYDNKLKRWDQGCFCMEETLSGGACVGDADGDGIDDLYYPRLDGTDILYIVDKHGNFKDQTNASNLFSPQMKSNLHCQVLAYASFQTMAFLCRRKFALLDDF